MITRLTPFLRIIMILLNVCFVAAFLYVATTDFQGGDFKLAKFISHLGGAGFFSTHVVLLSVMQFNPTLITKLSENKKATNLMIAWMILCGLAMVCIYF